MSIRVFCDMKGCTAWIEVIDDAEIHPWWTFNEDDGSVPMQICTSCAKAKILPLLKGEGGRN